MSSPTTVPMPNILSGLTGIDKAALLLAKLPGEVLTRVMERLGPERSVRVRQRMEALSPSLLAAVSLDMLVQEFESVLSSPSMPTAVTPAAQLAIYRRAAEQVADGPGGGEHSQPRPKPRRGRKELPEAEVLEDLSPDALAGALTGEKSQTVALVLCSLPGEFAGQVLNRLPPDLRRDVPVCLTRQGTPNPSVLERITAVLLQKAKSADAGGDGPGTRFEKIATMLRSLERPDRTEALAALQEQEPEAAVRVKELLYQFEDLLRIVDRSMQKLLSEVDTKSLAISLKGAPEEISAKVLGNLSSRARETLAEEMELIGSVPVAQVRMAQKTIVEVIQRLDAVGELQMEE